MARSSSTNTPDELVYRGQVAAVREHFERIGLSEDDFDPTRATSNCRVELSPGFSPSSRYLGPHFWGYLGQAIALDDLRYRLPYQQQLNTRLRDALSDQGLDTGHAVAGPEQRHCGATVQRPDSDSKGLYLLAGTRRHGSGRTQWGMCRIGEPPESRELFEESIRLYAKLLRGQIICTYAYEEDELVLAFHVIKPEAMKSLAEEEVKISDEPVEAIVFGGGTETRQTPQASCGDLSFHYHPAPDGSGFFAVGIDENYLTHQATVRIPRARNLEDGSKGFSDDLDEFADDYSYVVSGPPRPEIEALAPDPRREALLRDLRDQIIGD